MTKDGVFEWLALVFGDFSTIIMYRYVNGFMHARLDSHELTCLQIAGDLASGIKAFKGLRERFCAGRIDSIHRKFSVAPPGTWGVGLKGLCGVGGRKCRFAYHRRVFKVSLGWDGGAKTDCCQLHRGLRRNVHILPCRFAFFCDVGWVTRGRGRGSCMHVLELTYRTSSTSPFWK